MNKMSQIILYAYIGYLVLMSLITLILYKIDKNKAVKQSKERIEEKTLLGFSALGGALGALVGRIIFRHKTDKIYFSLVIYFSLLLEVASVAALVYLAFFR